MAVFTVGLAYLNSAACRKISLGTLICIFTICIINYHFIRYKLFLKSDPNCKIFISQKWRCMKMKPILYFNHDRTFGIVVSLSQLFVATLGKFTEVKANARSHSVSKWKSSLKKVGTKENFVGIRKIQYRT